MTATAKSANTPPAQRAKILVEALPYIRTFREKRVLIKYTAADAMTDNRLKRDFAEDVALISFVGIKPIIVHGGGPQIGELLKKLGKESRFVSGLRVTDEETMDVVEMVLVAKVNKDVVSRINFHGGKAVGISGRDGGLIKARKASPARLAGTDEDLGLVGEVDKINPELITSLEEHGFIPVIAPVGSGPGEKPLQHQCRYRGGSAGSRCGRGKTHCVDRRAGRGKRKWRADFKPL